MARIPMTSGFMNIPEGVYVFRIYDASYDEDFGKIEIKMVNAKGQKHTEKYSVLNADGEFNEKALGSFSFFAKTALNNYQVEDVDPEDLIDHYIRAEIVHTKVPNRNDPTKTITFDNLGEKSPADGFDTEPVEKALTLSRNNGTPAKPKAKEAPASQPATGLDLDALLG